MVSLDDAPLSPLGRGSASHGHRIGHDSFTSDGLARRYRVFLAPTCITSYISLQTHRASCQMVVVACASITTIG